MDQYPRMPGAVSYEKGSYGLEMMYRLFRALYTFTKEVKPDAVINMSGAHPYFAKFCDQFRLHDYDSMHRAPISSMRFRADMAKAVMPGILIDTDGFTSLTTPGQIKIYAAGAKIGVPDLYFFPVGFTSSDWQTLNQIWSEYLGSI